METRNDFLKDIFITAIEGGINYWCIVKNYRWNCEDFSCKVIEYDEDTDSHKNRYNLNAAVIEQGILKVKERSFQVNSDILAYILLADHNNDAGDIDSICADVIVQAGLFGEIVYG